MFSHNKNGANLRISYLILALVWTAVLSISLFWDLYNQRQQVISVALGAARTNLNKDLTIRRWATKHGGVYVTPTETTPPNPYLKVPERDIITTRGKKLTLMNPAYVLRELQEGYSKEFQVKSHLTSLKLLNKKNAPDEWEKAALLEFEKGLPERMEIQLLDNREYLRLMRPIKVEKGCLKCHEEQGYEEGDIRGGISCSVPLDLYSTQQKIIQEEFVYSHLLIWLMGIAGILFWYKRSDRLTKERLAAERKIQNLNLELEHRVMERTAQLEMALKDLETFSYSISHDLRTPLRAIDGFSQILIEDYEDKLDDEGKRLLNVVRSNTGRMSKLIDDILYFSRTGRRELSFSMTNMKDLVRDILDQIIPHIHDRSLAIDLKDIPDCTCDRDLIRQVLENLINNAVKFTAKKENPRIEIGGKTENGLHIYYVKDNGAGFNMQYSHKLFGVFQRLHGIDEFKGTGIGLAIVKQIVTRHGGTAWAEGKVGEGATFYFSIPVTQEYGESNNGNG